MKTLLMIVETGTLNQPKLRSEDIPMSSQSVKEAMEAGKRLKIREIKPDLIISENTETAIETASYLAEELDLPRSVVEVDEYIHRAEADELVEILRGISPDSNTVLLCGQQTSFTELANQLAGEEMEELEPGAIACIELKINSWKELDERTGHVSFVIDPDDEPPASHSQDFLSA
ncbi:MAG: hypothetical protein WD077_05645 [Bacteroidia bacterium]